MTRFLVVLVLALAAPAAAQTNLRGWHADGQTWLVWDDDQTFQSNESYSVYAAPGPILSLADGVKIGQLLPTDWQATRLKLVDPTLTFKVPDGQGGTYALAPNEALFVATPHAANDAWFAVVKTGDTAVGPDNTVGPVAQTVAAPRPHPQRSGVDAGHAYTVYSMWLDGRADHTDGRPDFPVMANASLNGTSQMFCVFEPTNPDPGPPPAVLFLHGGGGNAWKFRPSRSAQVRIDLDLEEALYVTLDDDMTLWTGPQSDTLINVSSLWYGYRQGWDRFEDPTVVPPDDALVPDYTHRRIDWILDWLVAAQGADEDRLAIAGISNGARGASGFSRARPERISATTLFVPPPKWEAPALPAIWGTTDQNLATTLPGELGFVDYLRPSTPVVEADVPFLRLVNGTDDDQVPWEDVPTMLDELEALRWGVHGYWDERGHVGGNGLWDGAHWTGSPDFAMTELLRFRRDVSFPAVTGLDIDPAPGRQPDPGDPVFPANGDPWGVWGGWVDWNPNTILDLPGRWAVTLRLAQPSPFANDPVPPAVAFRVTVRRPQLWSPLPSEPFVWRLVDRATGVTVQSGQGSTASDGTSTVEGIVLEETMVKGARLELVRIQARQPQ